MTERRLMAIYDLSSQPYSIGDLIMFQGAIMVLCEYYKLEKIDISFVLNTHRTPVDPVFAERINGDNGLHNLLKILPIVRFNPMLGSVFIWENDQQLEQILSTTKYGYIWPPLGSREYFFYPGIKIIGDYYNVFGYTPCLHPSEVMLQWAKDFYAKQVPFEIPITVNIRNNPHFGQNRNSMQNVWIDFFKYCAGQYPVKFVIICGITEVDSRLLELSNVVVAKNYHTSLEQDLTLISTAIAHIGTASGPPAIAMLNQTRIPFAIFKSDVEPFLHLYAGVLQKKNGYFGYNFSPPEQHFIPDTERLDLLQNELERILGSVDQQKWMSNNEIQVGDTCDIASWLR